MEGTDASRAGGSHTERRRIYMGSFCDILFGSRLFVAMSCHVPNIYNYNLFPLVYKASASGINSLVATEGNQDNISSYPSPYSFVSYHATNNMNIIPSV